MKWQYFNQLGFGKDKLTNAIVKTTIPVSLGIITSTSDGGNNPVKIPIITSKVSEVLLVKADVIGILTKVDNTSNLGCQINFYNSCEISTHLSKTYNEMLNFVKGKGGVKSVKIPYDRLKSLMVLTDYII